MAKTDWKIQFTARVHRPGGAHTGADWTFVKLPQAESDQLPSRGMVSVDATVDGFAFKATLEPDGKGGHWLRIEEYLRAAAGIEVGHDAEFEMAPAAEEPEPKVPEDFQAALEAAGPKAQATWADTTRVARRDWIFWITSGKKAETRIKRIEVACSKLAAGSRRPCCFDRSGMYDKSLSCPIPDSEA